MKGPGISKAAMTGGFILISLIWGSTWLAIKIGLESVPPFYGIALRFTVAFAVVLFLLKMRKETLPLDRNAMVVYFTLGVLSFSLPFGLVYWGEMYISSGLASILFAIYPFVVATLSHFLIRGEQMNSLKFSGILCGFLGVLLIFWHDIQWGKAETNGMLAILLSTLLQAFALITVKKRARLITPVAMNVGGLIPGLVVMYTLAFLLDDFSAVRFDAKGIGSILYLGTLGTVVTFIIYYWLLKHIEAVYMSLVAFVTPVVAVVLGAIVLDEELSPHVALGAALVLTGILIANGREVARSILRARDRRRTTSL